MKQSGWFKAWEILYPIGIYFVVTNITMVILDMIWPMTSENYMVQQIIATVIAFPFVYSFYRKEDAGKQIAVSAALEMVVATALFGVVMNNLIAFTNWKETSGAYQELAEAFYGSSLLLEIVGVCVLIPILEELLYRGIVYTRLRSWIGIKGAVAASAVIFGAMHFNLVQFVYAACVGVLLAIAAELGGLKLAIAAHMLTNLISVIRTETPLLRFIDESRPVNLSCTIAAALLAGVLLVLVYRRRNK